MMKQFIKMIAVLFTAVFALIVAMNIVEQRVRKKEIV